MTEEDRGTEAGSLPPAANADGQPHLAGQLTTFSPFELLQYLLFSGKAGCLELEHADGRQASCSVAGGSIAAASCGHLDGSEAVLAFVWWRQGRFKFTPGATRAAGATYGTIEALMMEAVRLADELEGLASRVPPPGVRLSLTGRASVPRDDLGCGLDLVASALRARPGPTRAELEAGLRLCPVKVRLGLALLAAADALQTEGSPEEASLATDPPHSLEGGSGGLGTCDVRVLVAHTAQAQRSGLLDAVQELGAALGGPRVQTELSPVGPSFVRFRPRGGGILSLTLLPISRRNRFLFETFVSSVDAALFCCGNDGGDEASAWKTVVPPGVTLSSVDAPAALCDELRGFLVRLAEARP